MPEIVFDDEPLETVLYGQHGGGKTPASLFGRAREFVSWVREAHRAGDMGTVIDICKVLAARDTSISLGMGSELAHILTEIVPQCPNPVLRYDLAPLCPLLEKIWELALKTENIALQERIAVPSYRCHEHYGQFAEAQRVLRWILEISRRTGNRRDEAIYLNNLGFEYLLEGRYRKALHDFDEAAHLFEAIDDSTQHANSRANYWTCKFESSELDATDQVEKELRGLAKTLSRWKTWQARKPMVVLARIAEQRGDLEDAIRWQEKAIKACEGSGTRYPETDAEYLQRLKETWHCRGESVL